MVQEWELNTRIDDHSIEMETEVRGVGVVGGVRFRARVRSSVMGEVRSRMVPSLYAAVHMQCIAKDVHVRTRYPESLPPNPSAPNTSDDDRLA